MTCAHKAITFNVEVKGTLAIEVLEPARCVKCGTLLCWKEVGKFAGSTWLCTLDEGHEGPHRNVHGDLLRGALA